MHIASVLLTKISKDLPWLFDKNAIEVLSEEGLWSKDSVVIYGKNYGKD